jgi:hypothetical protein
MANGLSVAGGLSSYLIFQCYSLILGWDLRQLLIMSLPQPLHSSNHIIGVDCLLTCLCLFWYWPILLTGGSSALLRSDIGEAFPTGVESAKRRISFIIPCMFVLS